MQHRRPLAAFAITSAALLGGFLLRCGSVAEAKNRYALEPEHVEDTRAFNYAKLSSDECRAELDRRAFPYTLEPPTKQVDLPLRFAGPIRGVTFKLTERAEKAPDATSPSAVADCRLALAIDDLAGVLATHDVTTVAYMSMYRKRGVGFVKPGKRHPSGRAIDIAVIEKKDGTRLSVAGDWHGLVGSKTCGEGAAQPRQDTDGARELRRIVCETAELSPFNVMLTPHYDWGHKDHFHFEVRSDIRWFLIQ